LKGAGLGLGRGEGSFFGRKKKWTGIVVAKLEIKIYAV
jgi:hypothetical protein